MRPLPGAPSSTAGSDCSVNIDYHVAVEHHEYSE